MDQVLQLSDAQVPARRINGNLLDDIPLLSPLAVPLEYRWPVTRISPDHTPTVAPDEPTLLLAHRDASHHVRFAPISPPLYRLLCSLYAHRRTGRQHLEALAHEVGIGVGLFLPQGLALLEQLRSDGIVPGTVKA
jgi:hypothetical protein